MKVRVGFGLGANAAAGDAEGFAALVDALDRHRFDSLWLSERVGAPSPDPVIGLAVAAGRSPRLKLGTSVQVLPGRNPVLLAKSWASLDVLSGGRLLPAFGLGIVAPNEQAAFGVERSERAPWFDEVLPLLRRFWTEDLVDHDGLASITKASRCCRSRCSNHRTCGSAAGRRPSYAASDGSETAG